MLVSTALVFAAASLAAAHGSHESSGNTYESWAEYHMAEEHHLTGFDAPSFFTLHDFNSDGSWTADEVRRMYGLDDESLKEISSEVKDKAVADVFDILDSEHTGRITRDAFLQHSKDGKKLPDFGLGPGHHGDDEYEYEIHHFEKYHDENTREEDLIHPEDVEHFRKHDAMEREQERIENEQKQQIVISNIPPSLEDSSSCNSVDMRLYGHIKDAVYHAWSICLDAFDMLALDLPVSRFMAIAELDKLLNNVLRLTLDLRRFRVLMDVEPASQPSNGNHGGFPAMPRCG